MRSSTVFMPSFFSFFWKTDPTPESCCMGVDNCMCPHEESNLDFSLRRAALGPLSYGDKILFHLTTKLIFIQIGVNVGLVLEESPNGWAAGC